MPRETKPCDRCGASFDFEALYWAGKPFGHPQHCDACTAVIAEEAKAREAEERRQAAAEVRARRIAVWQQITPELFQQTDLNHPEMRNPDIRRALAWQFGPRGLLIFGPTQKCKSRALYEICRRLYVDQGLTCLIFPPTEFGLQLAKAFHDGREFGFIERCRQADVVAFDDFGKDRITDRVQSEIFGVIDWRITHGRPVLMTTNYVGETLVRRFPDRDTAEPLIARLRGHFDDVQIFIPQPAKK